MNIEIDPGAGPCFGVERAIKMAEQVLTKKQDLLCAGDLIHNDQEISRLKKLGMRNMPLNKAIATHPTTILFRAHGEPPTSFKTAEEKSIKIIDATCPIVAKLQKQIAETYKLTQKSGGQIVIFGSRNHPEITSLLGFCNETAIIIESIENLDLLNYSNPIYLFSQTTKYQSDYYLIKEEIEKRIQKAGRLSSHFIFHDSSCKIVAQRDVQLRAFIQNKDIMVFVSDKKSSNGKQLFQICKKSGVISYFISKPDELVDDWFQEKVNIGVSGATSTPLWLLEKVKERIKNII